MKIRIKGAKLNFVNRIHRLTTYDTSNMENVKFANGQYGDNYYYNVSQGGNAIHQMSYILPFQVAVGSTVSIKISSTAPVSSGDRAGAVHFFHFDTPPSRPSEIVGSAISYENISRGMINTVTVPEGANYIDLYMFGGDEEYTAEMFQNAIEYIEFVSPE